MSDTTKMSIPSQYTEASFRRYEATIARIVSDYPRPLILNPLPLTSNTFACRLRDALFSLEKYNWSTTIDRAKLREIRRKFVIAFDEKGVYVGPRKRDLVPLAVSENEVIDGVNGDILKAYCILLHYRKIKPPIIVRLDSDEQLVSLSSFFDISFQNNNNGTFSIY